MYFGQCRSVAGEWLNSAIWVRAKGGLPCLTIEVTCGSCNLKLLLNVGFIVNEQNRNTSLARRN